MNEEVWSFEQWEEALHDSPNWEVFEITPEVKEKKELTH